MGYCIHQNKCKFVIIYENIRPMLKAYNSAPAMMHKAYSVEELFDKYAFSAEFDEDMNVVGIEFQGEKSWSEDELFSMIAPFVESGSFVEFIGEDGSVFRYIFKDKKCRCVEAMLSWPE